MFPSCHSYHAFWGKGVGSEKAAQFFLDNNKHIEQECKASVCRKPDYNRQLKYYENNRRLRRNEIAKEEVQFNQTHA